MKQEFKKGDRVLVRNNDLADWECGILLKQLNDRSHPFSVCLEESGRTFMWSQCRHIDDFRTGDKVQVRNSENYEWRDATYAVYVPNAPFQHWVFPEDMDSFSLNSYALCRWHPSMPWADKEETQTLKEPLTLEQRVEALERKLNEKHNDKQ